MGRFVLAYVERMTGGQRLLAAVSLIAVTSVLVALHNGGRIGALIATAVILGILWITRPVWLPEGHGKTRVRLLSLTLSFGVVGLALWQPIAQQLLESVWGKLRAVWPTDWGTLAEQAPRLPEPSTQELAFLLAAIFIVNYLMRDKSVMQVADDRRDAEFPKREFQDKLKLVATKLKDDLDRVDREASWNAENFVPLEAEVEVTDDDRGDRRITDLLSAIRRRRSGRAFLVIGEPGSGKSVALRKLCRELFEEVGRTRKLPLYINLREWGNAPEWSSERPPDPADIERFVLDNVKQRLDPSGRAFLDDYFERMHEHGKVFFIFDSFDEIPAVLDVGESSQLLDQLSLAFHRFIAGTTESRGILASRIFRRPTASFEPDIRLELRPLTERKLIDTIRLHPETDADVIDELFERRQDLIPAARNPFTAALLGQFIRRTVNRLPANRAELYRSHLESKLADPKAVARLTELGLEAEQVLPTGLKMAMAMFDSERHGLEAPLDELERLVDPLPARKVAQFLISEGVTLGRLGRGDEERFSFVHRRFHEYLIAMHLRNHPERVPTESIPTDSRWRDALALYCEVADRDEAVGIARFCWARIREIGELGENFQNPRYLEVVHCLRFLTEAFRSRPDCLDSFREEFEAFILETIHDSEHIRALKFAVEASGVVSSDRLASVVNFALAKRNAWINETVLRSCRHLAELERESELRIRHYFDEIAPSEFYRRRKDLLFSLQLSQAFRGVYNYCRLRVLDTRLVLYGGLIGLIVRPLVFLTFLPLIVGLSWLIERSPLSTRDADQVPDWIFNRYARVVAALMALLFSAIPPLDWQPIPLDGRLSAALVLIAFVPLFPALPWLARGMRSNLGQIRSATRATAAGIGMILLGWAMIGGIGLFFKWLASIGSWGELITTVAIFIGGGLIALSLVLSVIGGIVKGIGNGFKATASVFRDLRDLFVDYRAFKRLSKLEPDGITRAAIQRKYNALATDRYRRRFIHRLVRYRGTVRGEWEDQALFRRLDDPLVTRLAKLDEKWSNLDV